MRSLLNLFTAILLLGVGSFSATAETTLKSTWLAMIKAEFPEACDVSLLKIGTTVSGNNGLRTEQWFMQTCRGPVEYRVAYYPTTAFPGRSTPYEVEAVTRARPNNSFKPNPLRGSA